MKAVGVLQNLKLFKLVLLRPLSLIRRLLVEILHLRLDSKVIYLILAILSP